MSNDSWDGNDRRRNNSEDHDLLIKIDNNLSNHIELVQTHIEDDKEKFNKLDADLAWMRKILYAALGIVAFIEFMAKIKV